MIRILPLFLWIPLCFLALCGYSRHSNPSYSASAASTFISPRLLQSQVISGKVTDDSGVGMPGVHVLVKGTSNGTTTSADGNYTLNVSADESAGTLVFSFIGYGTQEIPVNNR